VQHGEFNRLYSRPIQVAIISRGHCGQLWGSGPLWTRFRAVFIYYFCVKVRPVWSTISASSPRRLGPLDVSYCYYSILNYLQIYIHKLIFIDLTANRITTHALTLTSYNIIMMNNSYRNPSSFCNN